MIRFFLFLLLYVCNAFCSDVKVHTEVIPCQELGIRDIIFVSRITNAGKKDISLRIQGGERDLIDCGIELWARDRAVRFYTETHVYIDERAFGFWGYNDIEIKAGTTKEFIFRLNEFMPYGGTSLSAISLKEDIFFHGIHGYGRVFFTYYIGDGNEAHIAESKFDLKPFKQNNVILKSPVSSPQNYSKDSNPKVTLETKARLQRTNKNKPDITLFVDIVNRSTENIKIKKNNGIIENCYFELLSNFGKRYLLPRPNKTESRSSYEIIAPGSRITIPIKLNDLRYANPEEELATELDDDSVNSEFSIIRIFIQYTDDRGKKKIIEDLFNLKEFREQQKQSTQYQSNK